MAVRCRGYGCVSFVAMFVAMGAFVCGYSIGSFNGLQNYSGFLQYFALGNSSTNSSCTDTSHLTEDKLLILGAIISIISIGGAIGNLFAGKIVDYIGRKVSLVVSGAIVVLGAVIQSAAVQSASWMLILGRFVAGVGYGGIYMAGSIYIAEIAPKHIRGSLTALPGPAIAVGIIAGHISNLLLYEHPFGWRVSRILNCIFGCVYIAGMVFMPRTPRWLMLKGREPEAREVLRIAASELGQEGIEDELKCIRLALDSVANSSFVEELKLLFTNSKKLERLILGIVLHFFSSACGNSVFYYSEPLFCSLGIVPFVTALVIGGLILCGNIFSILVIDKLGRKPLLVGGGLIMFVFTGTAATLTYVFNLDEEGDHDTIGYLVVCLICLFMLVFSATWHTVPWVVTSEIFPLEGRAFFIYLLLCFFSSYYQRLRYVIFTRQIFETVLYRVLVLKKLRRYLLNRGWREFLWQGKS
ncbi:uncharacterized protein LOC135350390 isoform X4 [Halichondria panicea]|uniref:uncharacterized protein LOC135350390 isoform X4 n=1 Tax=Halichondria panicea TaxID=6063 RepID=UPI00312B3275